MAGNYQDFDDDDKPNQQQGGKKSNSLSIWGNEKTMNLNPLILTNIQSSQYFKVNLYQLKTFHEVLDEIYYKVTHLEPWEKGSRKTSGQTGMCGGVRGVGAGGIVSTAYCILYKLYTLRLTRKQVNGLINHSDSPYIRGLGFMYIRYTQPPADLWDWLEPYMDDEEEIDVRAGGGQTITVGCVVRHMLTKLDWHATLFPRIPVPIQKDLEKKMSGRMSAKAPEPIHGLASARQGRDEEGDNNRDNKRRDNQNGDFNRGGRDRENKYRDSDRGRGKEENVDKYVRKDNRRRSRSGSRDRKREYGSRQDDRKSRNQHDDRSSFRGDHDDRSNRDFDDLLEREKYRIRKEKGGSREKTTTTTTTTTTRRSRSKSRDKHHRRSRSKSRDRARHRRSRSKSRDKERRYRH